MATRWTRSPVDTICGKCDQQIAEGAPVQEITIAGVQRTIRRCARSTCGGPAPADLPDYVPRDNTITPSKLASRFTRPADGSGALPFTDIQELANALGVKTAPATRDPGEEG